MWVERPMAHSIEVWRAVSSTADQLQPLDELAAEAELPGPDESWDAVVELCRQYPGLSRILAEYLAR
jgi:hypothetical protein